MGDVFTPSGQRLHVVESGSGRPLLLVHGWAMAGVLFDPLADLLSSSHRVVRYDLRGHGGSAPASSASLDDHAADLLSVIEARALDGAVAVAWSLGAQVLLRALPSARRRLAGAVLVAATPRFTTDEGWTAGLPARHVEVLAQRLRRDPARTRARFLADLLAAPEREALGPDRLAALDAAMPLPDPGAALSGLEILATADLRGELPGIDLPLLLLHGDADPICPAGASRAMAAAVPGARLAILAGAGHAPFLTREDEVAAAVRSFARGLA